MKKYFIKTALLLFLTSAVYAQSKPKTVKKEKPPAQKDMDEMMKQMQQAMDEMSPEDKKMMDSMGIKMPSLKNIPKVTDKQLADAWEEETRLVPKKDVARINTVPPVPTTAALPAFISKVHATVAAKMTAAEKTEVQKLYQSIKQNPAVTTSGIAVGLWIEGRPLLAAYLMGKACEDDPADIDNINNYAAMLTMLGAEQAALPILQNLNKRFPKNSTVLNNIGQAWFGLGDIDKAGRFLDSAILIYTYHSQANYTKCLIEESKGNTTAATEALIRSLKKSHSPEKESKLQKLGKKLSGKDVDFPFPMPQDPLGLEKFNWPMYPMNVTESEALEKEWDEFKEKCNSELNKLRSQAAVLEKDIAEIIQKRTTAIFAAAQTGKNFNPMPRYAQIAALKLNYLVEDKDNGLQYSMTKSVQAVSDVLTEDAQWQEERMKEEKLLSEKYDPLIGEGRPNPIHEYCNAVNKVRNTYLKKANTALQTAQLAYLENERKMINNQVYYSQYINWPEEFEIIKVNAKIRWLNLIKSQTVRYQSKGPFCEDTVAENKVKTTLAAFDDVACKYHSSASIGIIEFNNDCSRFEAKFKTGIVNYTRKIDSDDHDKLLAASLEIKLKAGKGFGAGPVQVKAKAEIDARVEWNDKEVTNWEVTSNVTIKIGKNIDIAGVEAQIGMNSGSSLTGKGILKGISITNK